MPDDSQSHDWQPCGAKPVVQSQNSRSGLTLKNTLAPYSPFLPFVISSVPSQPDVGTSVIVGRGEGAGEGWLDGAGDGFGVGVGVGAGVGCGVGGDVVGIEVGGDVGDGVGAADGVGDGAADGENVPTLTESACALVMSRRRRGAPNAGSTRLSSASRRRLRVAKLWMAVVKEPSLTAVSSTVVTCARTENTAAPPPHAQHISFELKSSSSKKSHQLGFDA